MKMNMNREKYVEYFNTRQPLESRKISAEILKLFEQNTNHSEEYYEHIKTMEDVREFLKTIPQKQYLNLAGEKQKRHRDPSLFKNTKIEFRAFPIDEELSYHWEFLAYDLETRQKYCWDHTKQMEDREKNRNQIYCNIPEIIDEFLALNLQQLHLTIGEKQRIIKFLEKYGPYFIRYHNFESQTPKDTEVYFDFFYQEFVHFKRAWEIIKHGKPKRFPHATTPPKILKKLYSREDDGEFLKWGEEIAGVQLWFKLCMDNSTWPTVGKPPYNLMDYGRAIGLLLHYLYQNCSKLIQCQYLRCGKFFFQIRKDQKACCPHHSLLLRVGRYKTKIGK